VESGDRFRLEQGSSVLASAGAQNEPVRDEVEFDLQDFAAGWDRRCAKSRR